VTDAGATISGTVTTSNPQGFDQFPANISSTTSWNVSVDVDSGASGGEVCNQADLNGAACGGTLLGVIIGYGSIDPITSLPTPIYATFECSPAANASASACESISPPEGECKTCFADGDYCTYKAETFNIHSNDPVAAYVQTNFATLFPSGLTIGLADGGGPRHDATWTNPVKFRQWIGGGGSSGALTADTLNATSTAGGVLARETATLTINLKLSGSTYGQPSGLAALTLCSSGNSLQQILDQANALLGGGTYTLGLSATQLADQIRKLNQSFDQCKVHGQAADLCRP
jgi:hypothetical protein